MITRDILISFANGHASATGYLSLEPIPEDKASADEVQSMYDTLQLQIAKSQMQYIVLYPRTAANPGSNVTQREMIITDKFAEGCIIQMDLIVKGEA